MSHQIQGIISSVPQKISRERTSVIPSHLHRVKAVMERKWISAPQQMQNAKDKKKEWFRVMFMNPLADGYSAASVPARGASRQLTSASGSPLPTSTEDAVAEITPAPIGAPGAFHGVPNEHLDWEHRGPRVVAEMLQHDPDLIFCTDVNKRHFDGFLWKRLRSRGYGCLFNRSHQPLGLPEKAASHAEETGSCVYYHKGRFFPTLIPGLQVPKMHKWCMYLGLRDKVCDRTVLGNVVCLNPRKHDVHLREVKHFWEFTQMLSNRSGERFQCCPFVMGNFRHEHSDAVHYIRDRLSSAYDIAGGPSWTYRATREDENGEIVTIKQTSEFMFYDPKEVSVLRVLDVPTDDILRKYSDPIALPNAKFSTPHMPLIADFAWTRFGPHDDGWNRDERAEILPPQFE